MADVVALIQGAGSGQRLGGQPKAFVKLWERTLLEIAIAAVAPVADRVIVAVPAGLEERARLIAGASADVIAGGATRPETFRRLLAASSGRIGMLHDVVHPLSTPALCRQVLAVAERTGAAAAAVPTTGFVYAGDAERVGPWLRDARWSMRKPICFELAAMQAALDRFDADPASARETEAGAVNLLLLAGQEIAVVTCPTWNVKITTQDDLDLCQLLRVIPATPQSAGLDPQPGAAPPGG